MFTFFEKYALLVSFSDPCSEVRSLCLLFGLIQLANTLFTTFSFVINPFIFSTFTEEAAAYHLLESADSPAPQEYRSATLESGIYEPVAVPPGGTTGLQEADDSYCFYSDDDYEEYDSGDQRDEVDSSLVSTDFI